MSGESYVGKHRLEHLIARRVTSIAKRLGYDAVWRSFWPRPGLIIKDTHRPRHAAEEVTP